MAAEKGHFANRTYQDLSGNDHSGGGNTFDANEIALAQKITVTPAASTANVCLATIQVQDAAGTALARPTILTIYLSDSAVGDGLTTTAASGAVAAGASGTDLASKISKKCLDVLTDATGKYILSITDTGKTLYVICVLCPGTGNVLVAAPLVVGNYG